MIRDLAAYVAGLWGWEILDGLLDGKKSTFCDIDGITERNGRFLVIEGKQALARVKFGQRLLFNSLLKLNRCPRCRHESDRLTVIVIWGSPPDTVSRIALWPGRSYPGTNDDLRQLVGDWYARRPLVWPKKVGDEDMLAAPIWPPVKPAPALAEATI